MFIMQALFLLSGCAVKTNKEVQTPVAAEVEKQGAEEPFEPKSSDYDINALKDVLGVAQLPNGNIVSHSMDGKIRIISVKDGSIVNDLEGPKRVVAGIKVLEDGQFLSYSKELRLWSSEEGTLLHTFEGHANTIEDVVFLDNGKMISYTTYGTNPRIWSLKDRALLHTLEYSYKMSKTLKKLSIC